MRRFTINISATLNGGKCKNPKITFIQNDDGCTLYPCEINEKTGEITIEILDGCPQNACIEGYIECEGDCQDCKTYFHECLCIDLDEIEDPCKKCVDGFIKDVCTPEQLAKGYVCLNGECVCPPSKPYKHPVTGECVECLDGMTDGCLICINGKWTEKECPEGVCDPATGECVECLDSGDCGPNKICVNGKCVCAPGYIDDGKGNCIIRPRCTDGSDCGPCEICVDGRCVPIVCPAGFICDPNLNDCVPNPCASTLCVSDFDCGDGCGCYNGECRPCHLIPCVDCASENCHCPDGTNCESTGGGGGGCGDRIDLEVKNCGLEGKLTKNTKCNCDVLTSGLRWVYFKPGETAAFTSNPNPDLEEPGVPMFPTGPVTSYGLWINMDLRKGISNSLSSHYALPRLADLDIINGLPSSWSVSFEADARFQTPTGGEIERSFVVPRTVNNNDRIIGTEILWNSIGIPTGSELIEYTLKVRVINLQLPNNCTYNPVIFEKTYTSTSPRFETIRLESSSDRYPLFTWTKSKDNFSQVFRKVFIPPSAGGGYLDMLWGPKQITSTNTHVVKPEEGELWAGYNYTLQVDCTCSRPKTHKLVVCDIDEFEEGNHFEILNCGRRLKLLNDFLPCPINRDVKEYSAIGYTIPTNAQVNYVLFINGQQVDSFIFRKRSNGSWGLFRNGNDAVWDTRMYDWPEEITNVALYQLIDTELTDCGIEQEVENPNTLGNLTHSFECTPDKKSILTVPQFNNVGVITSARVGSTTRTTPNDGNNFRFNNLPSEGFVKITVAVQGGCEATYDLQVDCCNSRTVTIEDDKGRNISTDCIDRGDTLFLVTISPPPSQVPVFRYKADGIGSFQLVNEINGNVQTGVYAFEANYDAQGTGNKIIFFNSFELLVDADGCQTEHLFEVSECNTSARLDPTVVCQGNDSVFTLTGDPNATVVVSTPIGQQTYQLNNNGTFSTIVQVAGDYTVISVNGNPMSGISATLTAVSSPVLSNMNVQATGCTNQNVVVTLTGTPGATVSIRRSATAAPVNVLLNGSGVGTTTFIYPNPGFFTISADTISLGDCQVTTAVTGIIEILQNTIITLTNTVCNSNNTEYIINAQVTPPTAVVSMLSGSGNLSQSGNNIQVTNVPNNTLVVLEATNGLCTSTLDIINNCQCIQPILTNTLSGSYCAADGTFTSGIGTSVAGPLVPYVVELYLDIYNSVNPFYTQTFTNSFLHVPSPGLFQGGEVVRMKVYRQEDPGCFREINIQPQVTWEPIPTWTGANNVCNGQSATLSVSFSPSQVNTLGWTVQGPGGSQTVSSNNTTLTFTPNQGPGTYTATITIAYGLGCTASFSRNIEVVPACNYEIKIVDRTDQTSVLKTVEVASNFTNNALGLRWLTKNIITEDCGAGINEIWNSNITSTNVFGFTYQIDFGNPSTANVTSVDIINNNVPETVAIPTTWSGAGNPRTSPQALAGFLNNHIGSNFFTWDSSAVRSQVVRATNVHGFDTQGTYTSNSIVRDFTYRYIEFQKAEVSSNNTPLSLCQLITFSKSSSDYIFQLAIDAGDVVITYNSITVVNPSSVLLHRDLDLATPLGNHNPTAQCCN